MHHDVPVVIAGAGPVGLSLALGLSRYGVRSLLLERKGSTSLYSKAPGILPRSLEIFRQWGVIDRFREEAVMLAKPSVRSADDDRTLLQLDLGLLSAECADPFMTVIEQGHTEKLLLHAVEQGSLCEVRFGHELVDLEESSEGVVATVAFGGTSYRLRSQWLAGCDGASSRVRDLLGLDFEGITYDANAMLADVRCHDARNELPWPRGIAGNGVDGAVRLESGVWRIISVRPGDPAEGEDVPHEKIAALVSRLLGPGQFETIWASSFRFHRRMASHFRRGNVLLAGDAAHVNSPVGGEGMNSGIQDAHNLAWKVAFILRGGDAERLLDSYDVERRDFITREVNRFTDLLTRSIVMVPSSLRPFGLVVARRLTSTAPLARRLLRRLTMLTASYRDSPLLAADRSKAAGERVPNVELTRDDRRVRLYDLIGLEPGLLAFDGTPEPPCPVIPIGSVAGWSDASGLLRKRLRGASFALVRPDHFIGWSGDRIDREAINAALGMHR